MQIEFSIEEQWGGFLGKSLQHTESHFLSIYLNYTKECRRITQKWAPHYPPMSCDLPVMLSGQSLDGHVIPQGSQVNIPRFPFSRYKIFTWFPPYFLCWPKSSVSRTHWRNWLNVNISAFFLWFLSQSLREFVVWGSRSFRHEEVSSKRLSILPTIQLNCGCFQYYPVTSSQQTQLPGFSVANTSLLPPLAQSMIPDNRQNLRRIKNHCLAAYIINFRYVLYCGHDI